jgi:hypothetical protein
MLGALLNFRFWILGFRIKGGFYAEEEREDSQF